MEKWGEKKDKTQTILKDKVFHFYGYSYRNRTNMERKAFLELVSR